MVLVMSPSATASPKTSAKNQKQQTANPKSVPHPPPLHSESNKTSTPPNYAPLFREALRNRRHSELNRERSSMTGNDRERQTIRNNEWYMSGNPQPGSYRLISMIRRTRRRPALKPQALPVPPPERSLKPTPKDPSKPRKDPKGQGSRPRAPALGMSWRCRMTSQRPWPAASSRGVFFAFSLN